MELYRGSPRLSQLRSPTRDRATQTEQIFRELQHDRIRTFVVAAGRFKTTDLLPAQTTTTTTQRSLTKPVSFVTPQDRGRPKGLLLGWLRYRGLSL